MKAQNIADVISRDGRVMWSPRPKFVALGFMPQDCGAVGDPAAKETVVLLNRQARLAKKRDRELRILAKADRIRATSIANQAPPPSM
jgi:hypothetical protein